MLRSVDATPKERCAEHARKRKHQAQPCRPVRHPTARLTAALLMPCYDASAGLTRRRVVAMHLVKRRDKWPLQRVACAASLRCTRLLASDIHYTRLRAPRRRSAAVHGRCAVVLHASRMASAPGPRQGWPVAEAASPATPFSTTVRIERGVARSRRGGAHKRCNARAPTRVALRCAMRRALCARWLRHAPGRTVSVAAAPLPTSLSRQHRQWRSPGAIVACAGPTPLPSSGRCGAYFVLHSEVGTCGPSTRASPRVRQSTQHEARQHVRALSRSCGQAPTLGAPWTQAFLAYPIFAGVPRLTDVLLVAMRGARKGRLGRRPERSGPDDLVEALGGSLWECSVGEAKNALHHQAFDVFFVCPARNERFTYGWLQDVGMRHERHVKDLFARSENVLAVALLAKRIPATEQKARLANSDGRQGCSLFRLLAQHPASSRGRWDSGSPQHTGDKGGFQGIPNSRVPAPRTPQGLLPNRRRRRVAV